MTAAEGNFHVSQDLEVLPPKDDKAYPIPRQDWNHLKDKIKKISVHPWLFQTIGSLLLGGAVSATINVLKGSLQPEEKVILWAIVIVAAFCGVVSLLYAQQQRKYRQAQVADVIEEMEILETRYEQCGA